MKSNLHKRRWSAGADTAPLAGRGIYLLHGLSEHTGRYEKLANWLVGRGWTVAAHDHQGHGNSGGERGRLTSRAALVTDAIDCIDEFAGELGQRPVLLGHSLGGALAAELALIRRVELPGLVLSSPALAPRMTRNQRWQLALMSRLFPNLTVRRPVAGRRLSHDQQVVNDYVNDPLVHGIVSARLIQWMVDSGQASVAAAPELPVQTLLMVAGGDQVVDPAASQEFARRAPQDMLTLHWYDDYFHEIFNEDGARRGPVLQDLAAWLERFEAPESPAAFATSAGVSS